MPYRLSKIAKAARPLGIDLLTGSKHWKFDRDGFIFPIPAHNGLKTEIDDTYLHAFCRTYGLDFQAFKDSI